MNTRMGVAAKKFAAKRALASQHPPSAHSGYAPGLIDYSRLGYSVDYALCRIAEQVTDCRISVTDYIFLSRE